MYAFWTNNKRKAELSEHIKELTLTVDNAAKSTLINSPFPLVIAETNGNIIWKSTKFVSEFANININNYVNELIDDINSEIQDRKDKNKGSRIIIKYFFNNNRNTSKSTYYKVIRK